LEEDIIRITESPSVLIDDNYYKKVMGESPENRSYPVQVKGIRIGWLLNNEEGIEFLKELLQTENLAIYDN
jgi:hypothetical protein